jgi:hypothetical protein
MATPGDTISIESVTALEMVNRFNTIKFTFTGPATLATVNLYDLNSVLISTLSNVATDTEYAIETGENVTTSPWGFFALPPMPVHIIDFITLGVDQIPDPQPVITNIQVGSKMKNGTELVFIEVNDQRAIEGKGYPLIVGGTPSEWLRDSVTGMYLDSAYISNININVFQGFDSTGDVVPLIGHNAKELKIDIGMLHHDLFKKFSGAI